MFEFLFMGLKRQLAQMGFWLQEIDINDDFMCTRIGTKLVVKIDNGEVSHGLMVRLSGRRQM